MSPADLCQTALAVVPVVREGPSAWEVFLSYLPRIAAVAGIAMLVVVVVLAIWLLPRRVLRWAVLMVGLALAAWAVIHVVTARHICSSPIDRGGQGGSPSQSAAPEPAAWATFMGGPTRRGNIDGRAGPSDAQVLWKFRDGLGRAAFAASPAVVDGRVYVGCDNQQLYCFDARTGEVRWQWKAAAPLFAAPVVADGRVYVGEGLHETTDGRLVCLDADTGLPVWTFSTSSHVEFAPTLHEGRLYVAAGDNGVYCLDAVTGGKLWQFDKVHVDLSPVVVDGGVFFGNIYGEPFFFRVDAADGRLVWKTPAPSGVCGSPSSENARVLFGVGNGDFALSHAQPVGAVVALDVRTGEILWKTPHVKDAVLTTPAIDGGRVYFGSRDGHLHCVELTSGLPIWSHRAGGPVVSSPAVVGGRVYFGCDDGTIACLDAAGGERLWSFDTGSLAFNASQVIGSPAVADGRLYVGATNFFFVCIGRP